MAPQIYLHKGETPMKKIFALILAACMVTAAAVTVSADEVFRKDTATSGDWVGKYGSEGYMLPGATADAPVVNLPDDVTISVTDVYGNPAAHWVWWEEADTPECPEEGDPNAAFWTDTTKTVRRAGCFYNSDAVDVTIDVGDATKQIALYLHDFDGKINAPRKGEVILFDENMNELAVTEVVDYVSGVYVIAEVTGQVTFEVVKTGDSANMAVNGIFVDPVSADEVFRKDTATSGDWVGKYGSEGYMLPGATADAPVVNLPDDVTISVTDVYGNPAAHWVWWEEADTPECPEEGDPNAAFWTDTTKTVRRAGCFYNSDAVDVTIDVGDATKQIALYLHDFDGKINAPRKGEVILFDENMNELAVTEVVDYVSGVYVIAEVTGQVTFEVVKTGDSANMAVNGIFVDPVGGAPAAPETEAPETEAPETEAPETEVPETEAPETEVPETEAPETETPETETPETEAPETEAPETEAPAAEEPVQAPQTSDFTVFAVLFVMMSAAAAFIFKKKEA